MTVVRRKAQENFTIVPNEAMRDESISIEARGLLALMMGMGSEWTIRSKDMAKRCGVGREKYQRMIRELKDVGYLAVTPKQDENGRLCGHDYILFDEPGSLETRPAADTPTVQPDPLRRTTSKKNNNNNTPKPPEGDDLFSADTEPESQAEIPDPIEERFKEFWSEIWPKHFRKTAKADCEKVYRSACVGKHKKADKIDPAELNRCARAYIASVRDLEYLKAPLAWLRQPGWEPFMRSEQAEQYRFEDLSVSQQNLLMAGKCPPSMKLEGKPNAVAQHWLKRFGKDAA